ncbi:MAG: helix-turn-helix domain-containing protein, partial [Prevotella sp.]
WINEYMMKDIRHLLKDTDKSVKEIAETLDFPNISFFGKYCRRCFGCSPRELRRRLRLPTE